MFYPASVGSGQPDMTLPEFHNALRIMLGIEREELLISGVKMTDSQWQNFIDDPFRWLIRASDANADKLWTIIQSRQPKRGA